MRIIKSLFKGWNAFEIVLLFTGLILPVAMGIAFDSGFLEILTTILSITMSLLVAKGKISGYILFLLSMALYAVVCWKNAVYGEVILILVFQYPVVFWGIRSWLRNKRTDAKKGQVVVIKKVSTREVVITFASQLVMGIGYFFILKALGTEQLLVSTILFAWSIASTYLLARRSDLSLLAYTINDIIAIVLWALILADGASGAAVVLVLQGMYLINDSYGVFIWHRLRASQTKKQGSEAVV